MVAHHTKRAVPINDHESHTAIGDPNPAARSGSPHVPLGRPEGRVGLGGRSDASELPSSYKLAAALEAQIAGFGLAELVDRIDPYGCIMAGELPRFVRRPRGRR